MSDQDSVRCIAECDTIHAVEQPSPNMIVTRRKFSLNFHFVGVLARSSILIFAADGLVTLPESSRDLRMSGSVIRASSA